MNFDSYDEAVTFCKRRSIPWVSFIKDYHYGSSAGNPGSSISIKLKHVEKKTEFDLPFGELTSAFGSLVGQILDPHNSLLPMSISLFEHQVISSSLISPLSNLSSEADSPAIQLQGSGATSPSNIFATQRLSLFILNNEKAKFMQRSYLEKSISFPLDFLILVTKHVQTMCTSMGISFSKPKVEVMIYDFPLSILEELISLDGNEDGFKKIAQQFFEYEDSILRWKSYISNLKARRISSYFSYGAKSDLLAFHELK